MEKQLLSIIATLEEFRSSKAYFSGQLSNA